MTVRFRKGKLRFWLCVPMGLVLFSLAKGFKKKATGNVQICIDRQGRKQIKKALKQAKRELGRLPLLNVQARDGIFVKIVL